MSAIASMSAEMQREFEADALRWLRRRLLWCCAIFGGFLVITTIATGIYAATKVPPEAHRAAWISVSLSALTAIIFLAPIPYVLRTRDVIPRNRLIWIVTGMICAAGFLKLAQFPFLRDVQRAMPEFQSDLPAGTQWMISMTVLHFLTSLLIPWTPREAIRPLIPVLVVNAVGVTIVDSAPILFKLGVVVFMCVIAVPGTLVAWLRHSRFRNRFHLRAMSDRFNEISQDLTAARRIHESILPRPVHHGPIRFDYRYEPMREIGGDYVHAHVTPDAATIVIIDVTGHGIGAAIAVNRLHAELIHQFAADPTVKPGRLLAVLNASLHSLAIHSMFATAICIRVDTLTNSLAWASAGHPPAFLRAADASIRSLESTAIVLGACDATDFDPDEQVTPFHAGDIAIAYTDGALEARNQQGKMLGIAGLERHLAGVESPACPNPGDWCASVLQMVDSYRVGPVQDDTLIVEISRPF